MNKLFLLLLIPILAFGQATTGYHRVNQLLARGTSGVTAQIVPNGSIYVTNTVTGEKATIYSDPGLSAQITSGLVTSDRNGNYDYYIPLNYCVNETVSSPGQGSYTTPNICINAAGGIISSGVAGQIPYYAANGTTVQPTSALPNGITATTQPVGDNSTKVATDAFVLANVSIPPGCTQSSSGNLTCTSLGAGITNGVLHPDQCGESTPPIWCSGATTDAWINAAIASIPSGGTVDMRGLPSGCVPMSSTVTAGALNPITLIFNPATRFYPLSNSVATVFSLGPNSHIEGRLWVDVSQASAVPGSNPAGCLNYAYTGNAINILGTTDFNQVPHDLSNVYIYAYNNTTATDMLFSPAVGQNISFYNFSHITLIQGLYGMKFNGSSSYINNNSFSNINFVGPVHSVYMVGGASGNTIYSNNFANAQFQWALGVTSEFIYCGGVGNSVQLNDFTNIGFVDVPSPGSTSAINLTNSACNQNYFQGALLSSWVDSSPAQLNVFEDSSYNRNWNLGNANVIGISTLNVTGESTLSGGLVTNPLSGTLLTYTNGAPSGNCVSGSVDINTSITAKTLSLYLCYPANTWSAILLDPDIGNAEGTSLALSDTNSGIFSTDFTNSGYLSDLSSHGYINRRVVWHGYDTNDYMNFGVVGAWGGSGSESTTAQMRLRSGGVIQSVGSGTSYNVTLQSNGTQTVGQAACVKSTTPTLVIGSCSGTFNTTTSTCAVCN
jgi:hypothetical protein